MPNYTYDLPGNYYFGGGGGTFGTPLAIVVLTLAIFLILALPRKYVCVPFLIAGLLIPQNVGLVVATLHFNAGRLLVLAGWTRILARGERYRDRFNSLDKVILAGVLLNSVAYSLVWREVGAIINRSGFLLTELGTYFLLRSLIRTKEDIIRAIKVLAIVVLVLAPLMWQEHVSQHNVFSLVGARELSGLRGDRVRAIGPFGSAINAGTFGVVLVPLFLGLWWYRPQNRLIAAVGVASSTVMMFASSSSTPVVTFSAGILALSMWPLRKEMRMVRWGIVAMLIGLQLVMKAPIWHLLTKGGGVLGGTGYHRAMLIEHFVYHFFNWCLIGTRDNGNWGWSMWDVDNAYVGAGLQGGLLGFVLFLAIFVYGYRMIGVGVRAARESRRDARLIWAIGAALFANSIAFLGIVYFDQSFIGWYALLVMISVIAGFAVKQQSAPPESESTPASMADREPIQVSNNP